MRYHFGATAPGSRPGGRCGGHAAARRVARVHPLCERVHETMISPNDHDDFHSARRSSARNDFHSGADGEKTTRDKPSSTNLQAALKATLRVV